MPGNGAAAKICSLTLKCALYTLAVCAGLCGQAVCFAQEAPERVRNTPKIGDTMNIRDIPGHHRVQPWYVGPKENPRYVINNSGPKTAAELNLTSPDVKFNMPKSPLPDDVVLKALGINQSLIAKDQAPPADLKPSPEPPRGYTTQDWGDSPYWQSRNR